MPLDIRGDVQIAPGVGSGGIEHEVPVECVRDRDRHYDREPLAARGRPARAYRFTTRVGPTIHSALARSRERSRTCLGLSTDDSAGHTNVTTFEGGVEEPLAAMRQPMPMRTIVN